MAPSAIRDHFGGASIATRSPAGWRVPHFEKMLYTTQARSLCAGRGGTGVRRIVLRGGVGGHAALRHALDDRPCRRLLLGPEDADSIPPERRHSPAAHKKDGAFYLWGRRGGRSAGTGRDCGQAAVREQPGGNARRNPQQDSPARTGCTSPIARRDREGDRPFAYEVRGHPATARLLLCSRTSGRPRPPRDEDSLPPGTA